MAHDLHETARQLVAEGKGILAADESDGTIKKRFDSIGIESTEDNRRAYRDMLFTTPGVEEFISGVILFDETIRQSAPRRDAVPGAARLAAGSSRGSRSTPARSHLHSPTARRSPRGSTGSASGSPSTASSARDSRSGAPRTRSATGCRASTACGRTRTRSRATRRCARRPGSCRSSSPRCSRTATHTIEQSSKATGRALQAVFTELHDQRVDFRGTLLKPNMVLSGYEAADRAGVDEVAEATLECFYRHVPAAVPGIVFLSGGQSDEDATAHLNAMNARGPHPWQLSFSYGRALQAPSLKAWGGDPANVEAAQRAFYHRAKMNGAARSGLYAPEMEREAAVA